MITFAALTWRPVDIILVAVIAAVIAGAIILAVRRKKEGFILLRRLRQVQEQVPVVSNFSRQDHVGSR